MLFDDKVPKWQGERTVDLLHSIAQHLSGRDDCKELEYRVTVTSSQVMIDPQREVFPNTKARKESDKLSVVGHVMKFHFADYFNYTDQMHEVHVKSGIFVPGRYIYRLSADKKKRRWERDDEVDK